MARSIEEAVEAAYAGVRPHALKRGRNPRWPYVPIVISPGRGRNGPNNEYHEQIRGRAFASREEALAYAAREIEHRRRHFADQLGAPRYRALREQWGVE